MLHKWKAAVYLGMNIYQPIAQRHRTTQSTYWCILAAPIHQYCFNRIFGWKWVIGVFPLQTWALTFLTLWTWAPCAQLASSRARSFYQRWPRPHSWPQMWRLKVSWVSMATRRTTRSTPHCCVSLSVVSALFCLTPSCPYWFPPFLFFWVFFFFFFLASFCFHILFLFFFKAFVSWDLSYSIKSWCHPLASK